jgi:hypothetical protein
MIFCRFLLFSAVILCIPEYSIASMMAPASYEYFIPPSPDYPDETGIQLIDGTTGTDDWRYNDSLEWTGWSPGTRPTLLFDFGSEITGSTLGVGWMQNIGATIQIPHTLWVYWSPDGAVFGDPWRYGINWTGYSNGRRTLFFDLSGGEGRFVLLEVAGYGWKFLDEVEFNDVVSSDAIHPIQTGSVIEPAPLKAAEPPPGIVYFLSTVSVLIPPTRRMACGNHRLDPPGDSD